MTRSLELPVALLALGLFLAVAFQTIELARDTENLRAIVTSQAAPLEEAARLKQASDSLASDIAALAQQGDANAKQVVDELARQNVQLRPGVASEPTK